MKAPNQRIKGQKQCRIVLFCSVNTFGAGGINSKARKPYGTLTTDKGGPDTTILALQMLKDDRTYLNMDSEESMSVCVIMKLIISFISLSIAYY